MKRITASLFVSMIALYGTRVTAFRSRVGRRPPRRELNTRKTEERRLLWPRLSQRAGARFPRTCGRQRMTFTCK